MFVLLVVSYIYYVISGFSVSVDVHGIHDSIFLILVMNNCYESSDGFSVSYSYTVVMVTALFLEPLCVLACKEILQVAR